MFHSPTIPGRWLCVLLLVLAMLSLPAGADAARRARAAVMINLSNGKVLYEHMKKNNVYWNFLSNLIIFLSKI